MPLRVVRRALGLVAALALAAGCADLPLGGARGYPIVESEVIADGDERIFWVDEDSVLFVGYDVAELAPGEGRLRNALYLWNVKTGKTEKIAGRQGGQSIGGLCFRQGKLMYFESNLQTKVFKVHVGRIGEMKTYDQADHPNPNRVVCDLTTPRHWEIPGRITYPLEPEHGYLDFGPLGLDQHDNLPARLVGPGVPPEGVVLPFGRREFHLIFYHPWSATYEVSGGYFDPKTRVAESPWPPHVTKKIWTFTPDGRSTVYEFSQSPIRDKINAVVPTRAGAYLIVGAAGRSLGDVGIGGLYRFDGRDPERVLKGAIGHLAVSPDGCRIAIVYAPSYENRYNLREVRAGERPRSRVIAIDVCAKGGADAQAR